MKTVEFHFDFGSRNAYLAHRLIPRIEARTGARFEYVPVLLGGVFKATNNRPPTAALEGIRNKPEYARIETRRWLEYWGIEPYAPNPHFPVNTLQLMRGAVFARGTDYYGAYVDAMYESLWGKSLKMDEPEIVRAELAAADLPVEAILEGMDRPDVKQALIHSTSASVERGTFGAPTFYLGDEIWFGKETLRDIEEALA